MRLLQSVDVVANASQLPFPPNYFQQIFSHNPFRYNPVSQAVVEVLEPEGILIVTGQPRNPFFKKFLKTIPPHELLMLGFELVKLNPVEPSLIIGTPKNTMGKPLDTSIMIQALFRKIQ
jgi:ubiquinone/menaquinone biosynthesis C-methylase UbiE